MGTDDSQEVEKEGENLYYFLALPLFREHSEIYLQICIEMATSYF